MSGLERPAKRTKMDEGDDQIMADKFQFTGDFVTLCIGPTGKSTSITVHETLITKQCQFFRAALNPAWHEGNTRRVEFPEDRHDVVATYVDWLYVKTASNDRLHAIQKIMMICEFPKAAAEAERFYSLLTRLHVFADKIGDDECCDFAVAAFTKGCDTYGSDGMTTWAPGKATIQVIFEETPPDSPLRRLVADIFCESGSERWMDLQPDVPFPNEFLLALTKCFMRTKGRKKLPRSLTGEIPGPRRNREWSTDQQQPWRGFSK